MRVFLGFIQTCLLVIGSFLLWDKYPLWGILAISSMVFTFGMAVGEVNKEKGEDE